MVVVARVVVSIVFRTMNWLPNTKRVTPDTLLPTLLNATDCVASPLAVAVSIVANVRPAAFVIGAYTVMVDGPLTVSGELIVSRGIPSAASTFDATYVPPTESTTLKSR